MSEWAMRRFWKEAGVTEENGGFAVKLDGRGVRTPAKAQLVVPTKALAQAIAAEWDAQGEQVDPGKMPYTRMANSAIDKVRTQKSEVADMLAAYGDSDLLCYRADHPAELVARQSEGWDPMLEWAATALGARLESRTGIMHAPQDATALAVLSDRVHALDDFVLAAFHDLVTMTGSLVMGFAVAEGYESAPRIWDLSRIDEIFQQEQWGVDEDAAEVAALKKTEFLHAAAFLEQSRAAGRD